MALRRAQKSKPFRLIIFIAAILVCLILLLPTLLSTAPFNRIIFSVLNRHVAPANLTIKELSLGWFSHQRAKHVRFTDNQAGIEAEVPTLIIEKNLLGLLLRRTDLGFVHLESPQVVVPLKQKADFTKERSDNNDQDEDPLEDGKGALDQLKPLVRKLLAWGSVSFKEGQIFGITNRDEKVLLLDQVLLQTGISKLKSKAVVNFSAQSGQNSGKITGTLLVTLPENRVIDSESFVGQGHLSVDGWSLEETLPLAALLSDQVPFGSGRLDGKWRIENPGGNELKLTGALKANNVVLYGGFLKNDLPEIERVYCQINALRRNGEWSLNKFQFSSPLVNGTAFGIFKEKVTIDTRVNIAPILKQLPNTLNVRDDLTITNGSVQVTGKASFEKNSTRFDGQLILSRLEGEQGKRKFAWKKPLSITGQGSYFDHRWVVEQAQIKSTFVNGNINASPDRFESRVTLDAAQAFKQADQFFKLPPIALQGLLEAHLIAKKSGQRWRLNIDAFSKALRIHSAIRTLSAASPFKIEGTCQYQIENGNHRLAAPQLVLNSGLLNGHFKADLMELLPNGRMARIDKATVSGKLQNGEVGAVYAAAAGQKPSMKILGNTRYEAAFDFNQDQIHFDRISLSGKPLTLELGRYFFSDQNVALNGSGVFDAGQRSFTFKSVNLSTSAGKSTFESLKLGDLRDPFVDLTAKGVFRFDLRQLALQAGIIPKQHTSLTGQGEAIVDCAWQDGMLTQLSVKGILAPLRWDFENQIKIDEPKVIWDLEMGSGKKRVSTINRLLVKSNLISLNGTGVLDHSAPKTWLQLNGNVDVNLEKLSAVLSRLTGQPVVLSGKKETPFNLKMSQKNDFQEKWFKKLSLETHFPASRLATMGITLEQMTMPTAIQNGQIVFDLKAAMNDGKVTLAPSVELTQGSRLTAKEGVVFENVRITQSLVEKFLAKLHPLFAGATAGQGFVDLQLNKLDWPLTEKSNFPPILDGQLTFNNVILKSPGMLDQILILLKADGRSINVQSKVLTFSYRDGRIVTSPLILKVNDTTLLLEGSMGFNQALDFVVKTPITKKMVSDKVYPLLVNSILTIPISGTVPDPQINEDHFYTELEGLVKAAGSKALKKEAEGLLEEIF